MTKRYCDICGMEIPPSEPWFVFSMSRFLSNIAGASEHDGKEGCSQCAIEINHAVSDVMDKRRDMGKEDGHDISA